jgi:hypothetical protein
MSEFAVPTLHYTESWGFCPGDALALSLSTFFWFLVYRACLYINPSPPGLEALKNSPKNLYFKEKVTYNMMKVSFAHSLLMVI